MTWPGMGGWTPNRSTAQTASQVTIDSGSTGLRIGSLELAERAQRDRAHRPHASVEEQDQAQKLHSRVGKALAQGDLPGEVTNDLVDFLARHLLAEVLQHHAL